MTTVQLQRLTSTDIPTCASLTARAFHTDRHTRVKQLGKKPFDLEPMFRDMLTLGLKNEKQVYVKAVYQQTNELLGWCGWGTRGVEAEELKKSVDLQPAAAVAEDAEDLKVNEETSPRAQQQQKDSRGEEKSRDDKEDDDPISRLHALESADMQSWMSRLMPPDTRCMFIISLLVSPDHQRRGVGGALVKWGAELADKLGIFTWVHASEEAFGLVTKHGFEEVGKLEVDLDEYAPREPCEEEVREMGLKDGKWGVYTLRYMKRLPKESVG